ncbi:MAG TPA: formate dehydrogenase accessory protein FdhE [Candidatus Dormibacteraeota bacterium]
MAVAITAVDPWTERRRRVGELRTRYGFARQVLDFYGALLGVQEKGFGDAAASRPGSGSLVAFVAEVVVPSVIDVTVAVGPDRLRSELIKRLDIEDPRGMIRRWMQGDEQPAVDRYLARASLGPVLEALGPEARSACSGSRDARHCPECGGPPQLSYFAVAQDDLATGLRYLLCARCGAAWGYPRMTCAFCGEDASSRLSIFGEHGTTSGERGSVVRGLPGGVAGAQHPAVFPHMRVDACESCRRYLLSIDLATERGAVPLVDELAAIPLDLYAREQGYSKITSNLMGF